MSAPGRPPPAEANAGEFSGRLLPLLGTCISLLSDIVLITEADPLEEPGPRIVFVNEAFHRLTGYTAAEVLGRTPRLLQGAGTSRAELARIAAALRRREVVRAELVNYTKAGAEYTVEMDIVPVAVDGAAVTHWVSIQRDVTARKQAEAAALLREAQRVASLGTLATGIAHDFNNIIAAVLGNAAIGRQLLADEHPTHPTLKNLAQIDIAGTRARRLVQQILAYSRRQPQAFVLQGLGAIVMEATDLLRSTLPAGVALSVRVADEPLCVCADATQLHQVLLNLGTNAWHAMHGRPGQIAIEVGVRAADGTGDAQARAPRWAVVTVSDDGDGMAPATLARVFEPYFTTKAIGEGTGLGLSVAAGIMAAHGGTVTAASAPGRGSVFTLTLPLADGAAPAAEPGAAPRPASQGAHRRVMLIDDDEVVLLILEAVLRQAGFEVTPFLTPLHALALFRADPAGFDIVVTDMNMPGCSGLDVARSVAAVRRELPVVVGSGYLDDALQRSAAQAGVAALFRKEYAAEQLGALLNDVLSGQAPPLALNVSQSSTWPD